MEYLMVDKKQAADSYGLLKMEINEWISTGFYDEEDDIVDFRIINYILKIKIINKEVYIY